MTLTSENEMRCGHLRLVNVRWTRLPNGYLPPARRLDSLARYQMKDLKEVVSMMVSEVPEVGVLMEKPISRSEPLNGPVVRSLASQRPWFQGFAQKG